jgi:tripartite-type tricarboxylate transporter receptor subunit TctC
MRDDYAKEEGMKNGTLYRAFAGLLATAAIALGAHAQQFPVKPLRMIVPFPPGGPGEVVARPLAEGMQGPLGQPVVVDFRPGAGATIGVQSLLATPPDGYTIFMGSNVISLSMSLYKKLPYDTLRDLRGVAGVAINPYLVLVPASFPAADVNDLIRMAKAEPNKLNFASSGPGTMAHVAALLFNDAAGIKMTHVPYKGAGPAIPALIAGEVHVYFDNVFSSQSFVKSGRLKALGVTSRARVAQFPDLPTLDEQGLKNFEVQAWFGVVTHKAVPDAIVARLNDAVNKSMQTPSVRDRYASIGVIPVGGTAQSFQKLIEDDIEAVRKVIREAGISLD